ncbi:MAG: hypothetical protein ACKN9R_05865 [Candidatus Limnocylindrus sp.]
MSVLLRLILASGLLLAGAAKTWSLWTHREVQLLALGITALEVGLAVSLLSRRWRVAAVLVSGAFAGAMVVNGYSVVASGGAGICGCLGAIRTSQTTALLLEALIVVASSALLFERVAPASRAPEPGEAGSR